MGKREDQFVIRLPKGWREVIKVQAGRHRRSMNQEILTALESVVRAATTGESLQANAPAVAQNTAALQGGDIINP